MQVSTSAVLLATHTEPPPSGSARHRGDIPGRDRLTAAATVARGVLSNDPPASPSSRNVDESTYSRELAAAHPPGPYPASRSSAPGCSTTVRLASTAISNRVVETAACTTSPASVDDARALTRSRRGNYLWRRRTSGCSPGRSKSGFLARRMPIGWLGSSPYVLVAAPIVSRRAERWRSRRRRGRRRPVTNDAEGLQQPDHRAAEARFALAEAARRLCRDDPLAALGQPRRASSSMSARFCSPTKKAGAATAFTRSHAVGASSTASQPGSNVLRRRPRRP